MRYVNDLRLAWGLKTPLPGAAPGEEASISLGSIRIDGAARTADLRPLTTNELMMPLVHTTTNEPSSASDGRIRNFSSLVKLLTEN